MKYPAMILAAGAVLTGATLNEAAAQNWFPVDTYNLQEATLPGCFTRTEPGYIVVSPRPGLAPERRVVPRQVTYCAPARVW